LPYFCALSWKTWIGIRRAYLVLREGFQQTKTLIDELRQAVRPIGSYKIPGSFIFIDQPQRTTLLKIDRRMLRGIAR